MDLSKAVKLAQNADLCLFCYEGDTQRSIGKILKSLDETPKNILVLIGPEGGFSESEVKLAAENGFVITGLGPRILRTETAPLCVLSVLSAFLEL